MKLVSAEEAVSVIKPGSTVTVSGGGYRVVPESLLGALEERFLTSGSPGDLTMITVGNLERGVAGIGGGGTGLNRFAHPGLLSTIISGSFSRDRKSEMNIAVRAGSLHAYNLPMGTVVQWLREIGLGSPGLVTQVGRGTFVDPRHEGGMLNDQTVHPLSEVIMLAGHECLFYPSRPIDIALIKGTSADPKGNIYFEKESFTHGVYYTALAARNSGGIVVAQVNRLVESGAVHPKLGGVPASMVDLVTVDPRIADDEHDPTLSGETRLTLPAGADVSPIRRLICRLLLSRIPTGSSINVGAGIPMYHLADVAREEGRDDIYFTLEQGGMGGWPRAGGVTRNPDIMLDSLEVFDYYQGGGPDMSCLAFGEVDAAGNVNVSGFSDMMVGSGGFINIVHGIRRLVFCGSLTTRGLKVEALDGQLNVLTEGQVLRFVPRVQQVTFNGGEALAKGQEVTYITERATFRLTETGLMVSQVAPGIDLQRDVMDVIGFDVSVDPNLSTIDPELYHFGRS